MVYNDKFSSQMKSYVIDGETGEGVVDDNGEPILISECVVGEDDLFGLGMMQGLKRVKPKERDELGRRTGDVDDPVDVTGSRGGDEGGRKWVLPCAAETAATKAAW